MMSAKYYRPLFKIIRRWTSQFTVIVIVLTCYIYGSKIEPNWIEVVSVDLTIPNLGSAFNQFKIVQISDLHSNHFMPETRLKRIIKLVNQQQPDAIAITGDVITKDRPLDSQKLTQQLRLLESKIASLAVLGNHERLDKRTEQLKQILIDSKIDNLDNQVFLVKRGTQQLALAGIDDPYGGNPDLEQVISQLPSDTVAVLLVHEPDYIETSAKTHRFVLQLSGHSHGGQMRIPFFTPLILPKGGRKYFAGLNQVEHTLVYTNRGLGMTILPFRFGSRPEITVFTLYGPA